MRATAAIKIMTMVLILVFPVRAEEVAIEVQGQSLKGSFEQAKAVPASPQLKKRVALLVSGSGPTDRDGNSVGAPGKNNSLKYVSETINGAGIATLRVDKRGVGGSAAAGGREEDLRFTTYIDDLGHWLEFLRQKGYTEIILIGHSEGALVATMAAHKNKVASLITVAGAGSPASELLRRQLKPKLPEDLYSKADEIITELCQGRLVADCPAPLWALFRASVQPYLISWLNIDPAAELAKLKQPVLIVQGDSDLQTSVADAKRLHKMAANSELVIIAGMNHVLKNVQGDAAEQIGSYFDPKLPLHENLQKTLREFCCRPVLQSATQP